MDYSFNHKDYYNISNNLGKQTVANSSKTFQDKINEENNDSHMKSDADIYSIQCLRYNKNMQTNLRT